MPSKWIFSFLQRGSGRACTPLDALMVLCAVCWPIGAAAQNVPTVQDPLGRPFVTVNGEPQPVARAEVLLREQLARGAANSTQLQAAVRETLVS
jgi:hypothetical protein